MSRREVLARLIEETGEDKKTRGHNAKLIGPTCLGSGSIASNVIPDLFSSLKEKDQSLLRLAANFSGISISVKKVKFWQNNHMRTSCFFVAIQISWKNSAAI